MAKNLSIGIEIGAALAGSFKTALGGAKGQVAALGSELKTIARQTGMIERLEKDQAGLEKARLSLSATQKEVARLKLALRKDPSDEGAAKALALTRAKADKLSIALEKQKQKLQGSKQALQQAGVEVGDLGREYTRLGQTMDKTATKQAKLNKTLSAKSAAGERLGELRGQMIGVAGAAYAAGRVIGEAMDFESAMADVRKVVDFEEPDGLQKFSATLKQMSREIPITAEGLAQIAAAGGQLGIKAPDLPEFTETVAKMATAFDMLPDEAGDAMAKLSNIYQIPISEMGALGDAINHLSDNTAAKAQDIVPVLARVGGTAKQFGLSAIEVAALGDAFIALGKPPEVAGTAINAMLMKLQTATKQGKSFQDGLEAMGMSAEGLESSIAEGGQAALTDFLEQLSAIEGQERTGILADMFGMEYADDISLLTGSLDQYKKALSLVADESSYAGSMTREFENRSATTANQLQLMKNSVAVLAINLGNTLLPTVNALLKPAAALANWAGDMAERFPWIGRLVGGLAAGVGTFVVGLTAVTAATWLWNAALLANPIGLTVAAIGGAAALIITFWEPISGFFSGLWGGIKEIFADGVAFLTQIWELSPLGLLFKAGQALGAVVGWSLGGNSDGASPQGAALAAAMPAAAGGNSSTTTVSAPINIVAAPGMDEKAIANQVDAKLREREQHAQARSRGRLYD